MKIVIGSQNKHKLDEIKEICSDIKGAEFEMFTPPEGFGEIEENGSTFLENALIKAKAVYKVVNKPVISDDTGLEVESLNGEPGIYSARYGGLECSYEKNCEKLIENLKDLPYEKRKAVFKTVAVFYNGTDYEYVEGKCEGYILTDKKGTNGFGYDPLFYVEEYDMTFAQMPTELKNKISHRANSLKKIKKVIKRRIKEYKEEK